MFRRLIVLASAAAAMTGVARAELTGPLIAPAELASLLETAPATRVIDIRAPEGDASYAAGRIPGAVNAPYGLFRGPKENPGDLVSDESLTATLRAAGLSQDDHVVIVHNGHDDTDFGAAARVYWTLKSAGFEDLAILNGGHVAWTAAGLPVSTEPVAVEPSTVTASVSAQWLATREDVRAAEGEDGALLVDARPDEFFRGLRKHDAAAEPGTLFGAVSAVYSEWFPPSSPVLTADEATLERARALAAQAEGRDIVSFCNTGHWAAINWFVLSELAGIENVKLYPESTVGWSRAGLPLSPGG